MRIAVRASRGSSQAASADEARRIRGDANGLPTLVVNGFRVDRLVPAVAAETTSRPRIS